MVYDGIKYVDTCKFKNGSFIEPIGYKKPYVTWSSTSTKENWISEYMDRYYKNNLKNIIEEAYTLSIFKNDKNEESFKMEYKAEFGIKIKDYKVINNKVVIVKFNYGDKIKTICADGDLFCLYDALMIAIAKYIHGNKYTAEGIQKVAEQMSWERKYDSMVRKAIKDHDKREKEELRKIEAEKAAKEESERIKKSRAAKRKRKLEKRERARAKVHAEELAKVIKGE